MTIFDDAALLVLRDRLSHCARDLMDEITTCEDSEYLRGMVELIAYATTTASEVEALGTPTDYLTVLIESKITENFVHQHLRWSALSAGATKGAASYKMQVRERLLFVVSEFLDAECMEGVSDYRRGIVELICNSTCTQSEHDQDALGSNTLHRQIEGELGERVKSTA